jgi:hypothetical protein
VGLGSASPETFRCQACGTTFSAGRDTPFYRLKTASQRDAEVSGGSELSTIPDRSTIDGTLDFSSISLYTYD